MATYKIETDSFTAAVAQLVEAFKKENPGIGTFKCTCHDGTKVTLNIAQPKPPKAKKG